MIKISPSQHIAWQQQHRRSQRQLDGFHRLNEKLSDGRFERILRSTIKGGASQ